MQCLFTALELFEAYRGNSFHIPPNAKITVRPHERDKALGLKDPCASRSIPGPVTIWLSVVCREQHQRKKTNEVGGFGMITSQKWETKKILCYLAFEWPSFAESVSSNCWYVGCRRTWPSKPNATKAHATLNCFQQNRADDKGKALAHRSTSSRYILPVPEKLLC